jgi:hypothetical protein
MASTKIRLTQIERGDVLQALIRWYEGSQRTFAQRFNALRQRSRAAATAAGIGPRDIEALIHTVRRHRAKT